LLEDYPFPGIEVDLCGWGVHFSLMFQPCDCDAVAFVLFQGAHKVNVNAGQHLFGHMQVHHVMQLCRSMFHGMVVFVGV
jgi:hypothetical protein